MTGPDFQRESQSSDSSHEATQLIIKEILLISGDIQEVQRRCLAHGAEETFFGHKLSRSNRGLDIIINDSRYLFYPTNQEDLEIYRQIEQGGIPHFEIIDTRPDSSLVVARVPIQAEPMDGRLYPEQGFTQGYLGAYEKMAKLGEYLAQIFKATRSLPRDIKLINLAFINGDKAFIRIIPPYDLGDTTIEQVQNSLLKDLQRNDPSNHHEEQVQTIGESFHHKLQQND